MTRFQRLSAPIQFGIATILLLITMLLAIRYGAANTTYSDIINAIFSKEAGEYYSVLREIRFPRVIAAFFVGSALAVSGAIMQGMTRNPLADPGLLGLTAGANAALAITLAFFPSSTYSLIILACFIGAGIGIILVFGIGASAKGGLSPMKLVLAGAAITMFLQALADGIGILFHISKDVSMWTAGGLIGTTWQALLVGPVILIGLIASIVVSRQLTILSLNEEVSIGLGQRTAFLKIILMVITIVLAGSAVALAGNLAFIGLMIPHIVRALVGSDYRFIIPMSIIIGGLFMVAADLVGRTLNAPFETPVVALIAIIGLPFFLFIVRKGGQSFAS